MSSSLPIRVLRYIFCGIRLKEGSNNTFISTLCLPEANTIAGKNKIKKDTKKIFFIRYIKKVISFAIIFFHKGTSTEKYCQNF